MEEFYAKFVEKSSEEFLEKMLGNFPRRIYGGIHGVTSGEIRGKPP